MSNKFFISLILLLVALNNCSFDRKTGLWKSEQSEKARVLELEKKQKQTISINTVYSSENIFSKEKKLSKKINLAKPKNISLWQMSGLNEQNFLDNIYLSGIDNIFFKKKIGKDKFSLSKNNASLLIYEKNIIFSDDTGTIFSVNQFGKINWKKNIYKKLYKRIYKNLSLAIYKGNIYASDNIGFIYSLDLKNGKTLWIKNHGIPLKSKIKVFENKIFLVNQDNKIFCISAKDGSSVWNIRSISSFIKSQSLLSLAITKDGFILASTSSGDLLKIDSDNGQVVWAINTLGSTLEHATDFFKSSDIVVSDDKVIFSTQSSIFSFNLKSGYINWKREISSVGTPIVVGNNLFFVTANGYFLILNLTTGKILSSTNILKVLKKKKQLTEISGFIMGSGKIYSLTSNGFLIKSSASSGEVEDFKKIGGTISSSPVISDGKLFIYTESSKIIGLN